jgi:hypothetical protein
MLAIRYPNEQVILTTFEWEKIGEFNLHYSRDIEEYELKVQKNVRDILSDTVGKWINCRTLEVEE